MGWSEANLQRRAGRIVVAVVCFEQTVNDAALEHIGRGRLEVIKAQGMDRLREGLYLLAVHWACVEEEDVRLRLVYFAPRCTKINDLAESPLG